MLQLSEPNNSLCSVPIPDVSPVIPDEMMPTINLAMYIVLLIISFLGILSNTTNMIVFTRLGFVKHSVNINLCALAVSDLINLASLFGSALCIIVDIFHPRLRVSLRSLDMRGLVWIQGWFSTISNLITVYITIERSLIVLMPFTFRTFVTPKKTIFVLACIYLALSGAYGHVFALQSLQWAWNPALNLTQLTFVHTGDIYSALENLDVMFIILTTACQVIVSITTILLVRGLRISSEFRKSLATTKTSHEPHPSSDRDEVLLKVVQLLAVIFVLCNIPILVLVYTQIALPNYGLTPRYRSLIFLLYTAARISGAVNSSVNFLVYYRINSKFRAMFKKTFIH